MSDDSQKPLGVIILIGGSLAVAAFCYAAYLITWRYSHWTIPTESMNPTLAVGDWILARGSKFNCGAVTPKLGDIVIHSNDPPFYFIRRVVAGPGDKVEMDEGRLVLNDKPVDLRLTTTVKTNTQNQQQPQSLYRETLPNGRSYQILDAVSDSIGDTFGPTVVPAGHWFLMGDHRDNSNDSRFEGAVPAERICAIAFRRLGGSDKQHKPGPL